MTKFARFDQVKIITTKNVNYLSAPPQTSASPSGIWTVVAALDKDRLLLAHNNITILIPAGDVLKIAGYELNKVIDLCGRLTTHVTNQSRTEENPAGPGGTQEKH